MEKARRVDRIYCEIEPGQVGPVEAKLLSYERVRGLVFGAFGEVSQPVHQLIDALGTSRVAVARPQRARMGLETQGKGDSTVMGESAIMVGQIRRRLSMAPLRAQCLSLHSRLEVMGTGLKEAVARRAAGLAMDHSMEQGRMSFLQTLRQPQRGIRSGFSKVE